MQRVLTLCSVTPRLGPRSGLKHRTWLRLAQSLGVIFVLHCLVWDTVRVRWDIRNFFLKIKAMCWRALTVTLKARSWRVTCGLCPLTPEPQRTPSPTYTVINSRTRLVWKMDQLPFDILFQFLVSLQDLQSLRATTLTSKKFWDAFQANQNTILHSILGYELGPTALVHARALYHANTCRSSNATDHCFVSPQKYFKGPIACKEARALSHYGCTARRLATYFTTL